MPALLAALYSLCLLLLTAFSLYVFYQNPYSRLNRYFALLALALLGWVASLFAFNFSLGPGALLWDGRLNFACIVFVATLGFLFVQAIPATKAAIKETVAELRRRHRATLWLWTETALLGTVTLLTPWVDQAESVGHGQHLTLYGPLFAFYMAHVLVLLGAAIFRAFRPPKDASPQARGQLALIGGGFLATAAVTLVTNVVLPYAFRDFRFIHIGTLSTILFLAAAGYAVFARHLFNVRVIVRATFVYAGLIALALEMYQLAVTFLAHLLPFGNAADRGFAATAVALVINAFTQQPVRRRLEQIIDGLAHKSRGKRNLNRSHLKPAQATSRR